MKATLQDIQHFLEHEFPQSLVNCSINEVFAGGARVSYHIQQDHLRPGGTVSGPSMFTIADFAMYVAVLGQIGLVALAVTSNINIHFLRKPTAGKNLEAECRIIKTGRQLVVAEVWVYSIGQAEAVAHVTGSYALPST